MIYDLRKKAEEELLNNLGPFWLKLLMILKLIRQVKKVEFKHQEYYGSSQRLIVQQKMKNIKKLQHMLTNF